MPPLPQSAYFRARYPKSWWWTADIDFLAAVLHAIQAGNWQRSGGKGDKPKFVQRPKEGKRSGMTTQEVDERKKRLKAARYGN